MCIIFIFSSAYLVTVRVPHIGERNRQASIEFKKRFANVLANLMIFQGGVCLISFHCNIVKN